MSALAMIQGLSVGECRCGLAIERGVELEWKCGKEKV